jgi:2-aminoadipate transaminase
LDYKTGIKLDHSDDRPLYEQIVSQIADRVRSGAFPVGHRLPPTRELAAELGTNRNTVVRAFEELAAMGLTTSTVGRGTFIAAPLHPQELRPAQETSGAPPFPWSSVLSRRMDASPLLRYDRLARSVRTSDAVNLQTMQPSPDLMPVDAFRRCIDYVLRKAKGRSLSYAPREGHPELRAQIAKDVARLGVPVRAEDVIVTTGSQQAIDLVARALVDPGDVVLLDDLSYAGAINLFSAQGATLVGVRNDREGPDLGTLAGLSSRGVKLMYLMPNCQNPTGATIGATRREALVRWSRSAGIPLVEDDYAADLNLDGAVMPTPLRALDPDVIYIGTYSKKLIPGLRIGFLVTPPALRSRLIALKHALDIGTSLVMQLALAEFLDRGYMKKHLATSLMEYRARRDALEESLAVHLPKEVTWKHAQHGVTLWLELPNVDAEPVFRAAEKRGVLVTPGHLSSPSETPVSGLRLSFCAEPPDRIREGAKRLGKALEEALGAQPPQKKKTAHGLGLV